MIRKKTQVSRGRRTRSTRAAPNPGSGTPHELLQHVGIVRLFHPARLTESGAAQIFQRRACIGINGCRQKFRLCPRTSQGPLLRLHCGKPSTLPNGWRGKRLLRFQGIQHGRHQIVNFLFLHGVPLKENGGIPAREVRQPFSMIPCRSSHWFELRRGRRSSNWRTVAMSWKELVW